MDQNDSLVDAEDSLRPRADGAAGEPDADEAVANQADAPARRRALGLFRLIRDYARLRTPARSDVEREPACLWLGELPRTPSCRVWISAPTSVGPDDEDAAADAAWARLEKLDEPSCPAIPPAIAAWVDPAWPLSPDAAPTLRSAPREADDRADAEDLDRPYATDTADAADATGAVGPDDAANADADAVASPEPIAPVEPPAEVRRAFDQFVADQWTPWSRDHAAWRTHDAAYTELFAIAQAARRREEDLELVVGLGLLTWDLPGGEPVRRHLVTVPVSIEFDAATGRLSIVPSPDPASPQLEMLPSAERPEDWPEAVAEAAHALAEPPVDPDALESLFRRAANALGGGRGRWQPALVPPRGGDGPERPEVTLAPALVLQRRERGLLVSRAEDVVEQIERGAPLPPVVGEIVRANADADDVAGADPTETAPDDAAANPEDARATTLFPLPANDEQFAIVGRLQRGRGVLVQGPPGTGKSHTIANLVCHLLAEGRRVLVTAQSPRALAVLRDKLPEDLRPLCIALLGNDGRAMDELAQSVAAIVERCEAPAADDERRATDAEARRRELRSELEAIDVRVAADTLSRRQPVAVDGSAYRGTPEAIARAVAADRPRFAWLDAAGDLAAVSDEDLEGSADSMRRARAVLVDLGPERRSEIDGVELPRLDDLPDIAEVRDAIERERTAAARLEVLAATTPEGPDPDDVDAAGAAELEASLSALLRRRSDLESRSAGWVESAMDDVLRGEDEPWRERRRIAAGHAEEITALIGPVEDRELTIPAELDRSDVRVAAEDLMRRQQRGGSTGGFARLLSPAVRRARAIIDRVRVDGRPCDDVKALQSLLESLEVEQRMQKLDGYLRDLVRPTPGPLRLRFAGLTATLEDLGRLERLAEARATAEADVRRFAATWLLPPDWTSRAAVEGWRGSAAHRVASATVEQERQRVDDLAGRLDELAAAGGHPISRRLSEAVRARELEAWIGVRSEIERLHEDAERLEEAHQHLDDVAPALDPVANALAEAPESEDWPQRLADVLPAAGWARAEAWLLRRVEDDELESHQRRAAALRVELERATGELASARAWLAARDALDEDARRVLQAWVLANRNLGRGTGRHAARRRRAARELLGRCRDAVPAWIMPVYRVLEQVEPEPGAFDAVIVDEASQCGMEASLLSWLAGQLIVVGDDEQISPTVIIDREPLYELARTHLGSDPIAAVLEPDTSLFDLGRVWFDEPVRLREHFRCMPEIIGFSDRLAYDGQLIPLRLAPPDRLEPVRTVHVPAGVRVGRSGDVTNPPEAAAMVEAIVRCHADPRYAGRSFGVVSLLGERQATLVESMLTRALGPEAMEARRIICGDAYSFQGDERDVMFLGLVAATRTGDDEPARVTALVRRDARQRFNVAVSRARDQLWLVHSVELDDLRNPDDVRRRLLEYCLDPSGPVAPEPPDDAELRQRMVDLDPDRDPPPSPFAGWLEVEVYRAIRARGFTVLPGHPVAGQRLDLVVTDGRRMVAVDCADDGPRTRDAVLTELRHRRRLERVGWTIAGVSGVRYHLDPGAALSRVWDAAARAGIDSADSVDGPPGPGPGPEIDGADVPAADDGATAAT